MTDTENMPEGFDELVRQYRGAAQRREETECIRLLKELHHLDPGNRCWLDDLERFRQRRFSSIEKACREAMAEDNEPRVWALIDELATFEKLKAGASLKREAVEYLRGKRRIVGDQDGRKARDDLIRLHGAGDLEGTVEALRVYGDMVGLGLYKRTPEDKRMAEAARAWVKGQRADRKKDELYKSKVQTLRKEVARADPGPAVETLLKELDRFKRPIPDDLQRRAREVIDAQQSRELRRVRAKRFGWGIAAAITLAGFCAAAWWLGLVRAEKTWSARLETAYNETDLEGFRSLKGELSTGRHLFYGSLLLSAPSVREWLDREDELVKASSDRRAAMERVLEALESMREGGYDVERFEIETFLEEGRKLALGQDDLKRLETIEADWRSAKRAQAETLIQRIADAVPGTEPLEVSRLADAEARLNELQGWIEEARRTDPAPPEVLATLATLEEQVSDLSTRVGRMRGAMDALQSSETIVGYIKGLRDYADGTVDERLAGMLGKILELTSDYKRLIEWSPSTPYRTGSAVIPFESTPVGRFYPLMADDNHFWSSLLKQLETTDEALLTAVPKVKSAITSLRDDRQLTGLRQYKDVRSGSTVFMEGELYGYEQGGDPLSEISGQIYKPGSQDVVPEFSFRKTKLGEVRELRRMPHCLFVEKLVKQIDGLADSELDVFLLGKVLDLHANAEIANPYLKLKLIQFLLLQLTELGVEGHAGETKAFLQALQRIDNSDTISWLCVANPRLDDLNKMAETVTQHHLLGEGARWIREYRFRRLLRSACAGRGARFAGMVDITRRRPVVLPGRSPAELWVLRRRKNGLTAVYAVADRSSTGTYEAKLPVVPGEPLFAPSGKTRSGDVLARCLELSGLKQPPPDFEWPAAWPVNRRR